MYQNLSVYIFIIFPCYLLFIYLFHFLHFASYSRSCLSIYLSLSIYPSSLFIYVAKSICLSIFFFFTFSYLFSFYYLNSYTPSISRVHISQFTYLYLFTHRLLYLCMNQNYLSICLWIFGFSYLNLFISILNCMN